MHPAVSAVRNVRNARPLGTPERPLSIVVLGNSMTFTQLPHRDPATGTYGEVLRDRLSDAGIAANLHLEGRWFEFIQAGLRRYEPSVRAHVPDVLVIQYGLNESQPYLVPIWLLRHFITDHKTASKAALWYRRHVSKRLWKKVRTARRAVSPAVGTRTWQVTPDRFTRKLVSIIKQARKEFRPLVLVLDVAPPGPLLTHYLPGQDERHRIYQDVIERAVTGFDDPEIRLVRTEPMVHRLGFPEALPDGMHFSPLGHQEVGDLLAGEVFGWLGARETPLQEVRHVG
jgi:lysophospholipase L1-like esterase